MIPDIQKTAALVQEIVASSKEQDTGASQINSALLQLDTVVQQNAASSEELASTAEELSAQAMRSLEKVSYFRLEGAMVDSHQADTSPRATTKKLKKGASNGTNDRRNLAIVPLSVDNAFDEF